MEILVPPLVRVFRSKDLPTALRMSAVSLLSECVDTNSLALLRYTDDLASAMLDLLQVETVAMVTVTKPVLDDSEAGTLRVTMDSDPTTKNSKLPPFRRAALHFLALLVRAYTVNSHETNSVAEVFQGSEKRRALTTLRYIAATDEDSVVRVMAREVVEALESLETSAIGL